METQTSQDVQYKDTPITEENPLPYRNTVTFLDWDDTLFPSTYLSSRGYRLDSKVIANELLAELKEIEERVSEFLDIAVKCSDEVYIVTNAENGWVELSAAKFTPHIASKISKIKIISARTTYEELFPNSPYEWKLQTFKERIFDQLKTRRPDEKYQVISFGDSNYEREAIRAASQLVEGLDCKVVKLYERPTAEQLIRQIELIIRSFDVILRYGGQLDMRLSIFE